MKFSKDAPVKIIVLGAGGTGGWIIPHLYRIGYASSRSIRVVICDGDIVEAKNLIRQNFIVQDVGENKAKILAERYSSAFGLETEYRPTFIESAEELVELVKPDITHYSYDDPIEEQRVILIGAVDNNKSRQLCNEVFKEAKNLVYIDSGNGESTGQVVCGIRQKGKTMYKPVCSLYPEMLKEEDKFPSELSCADRNQSAPQSITANLFAANAVVSFLYNLLIAGELTTRYVTFSSKIICIRAETVKKRRKKSYGAKANQNNLAAAQETRQKNRRLNQHCHS